MKYMTLKKLADALTNEAPDAFAKMCVAVEVASNIDISSYDDEGFEELCNRVQRVYLQSDKADLSLMCYHIQQLLDDGEYETPTIECVVRAADMAEPY